MCLFPEGLGKLRDILLENGGENTKAAAGGGEGVGERNGVKPK